MITWERVAAAVREMAWTNPLLKKYNLDKFGETIPSREVISLCEQLKWTEEELKRERGAVSAIRAKVGPKRANIKRRYVKARPNASVAAHRTKPTLSLGALVTLWPIIQYFMDNELSDTSIIVLTVVGLLIAGHYMIFLVVRSD